MKFLLLLILFFEIIQTNSEKNSTNKRRDEALQIFSSEIYNNKRIIYNFNNQKYLSKFLIDNNETRKKESIKNLTLFDKFENENFIENLKSTSQFKKKSSFQESFESISKLRNMQNEFEILNFSNPFKAQSNFPKINHQNMIYTICGSFLCLDLGGNCIEIDKCNCIPGFINNDDNSIFKCSYPQYDAKIAFFFEFFIGFGSGHFYVKRYFFGILKFGVYFFLYLFAIILHFLLQNKKQEEDHDEYIPTIGNPYYRFARIVFMCSCFYLYNLANY